MITVYGAPPTRAVRVIWMLEEMGLPYEVRPVDFRRRHEDAEFLAASPAGMAPGLADGEVRMMESVAMLEYLAARYGPTPLAPSPETPEFPLYQQFLHFGESSLAAPLNIVVASRFFAPDDEKDNWGARTSIEMVVSRWVAVEAQLKRTPYVAGETFTAADISCAYAVHLGRSFGFFSRLGPVVAEYAERVATRPAYQAALVHGRPLFG